MASKKYGVIWANTTNLGDDIQTLAAINFLRKKGLNADIFINREDLINYRGPDVILLMNGWYMHDISKFPPPECVTPVFISFHCAQEYLISKNLDYFKKYEPIGCRDTHTQKLFKKYNIKTYFSECLTLYFDPFYFKSDINYIVDLKHYLLVPTYELNYSADEYDSLSQFSYIPTYAIDKLDDSYEELTHLIFERKDDLWFRLEKAGELLDKYSKANMVYTSRLHVALPCSAFKTNVKFIHPNFKDARFMGLQDILVGDQRGNDLRNAISESAIQKIIKGFDNLKI